MLKIFSLGGFGNVTTNMFVYETERDILLVDCGIGFPSVETEEGDLLVPDVSYLQTRQNKIRGLVITHGHEDHLGALPFVLPKIGAGNFPIFGAKLTATLAKEKLADFDLHLPVETVGSDQRLTLGEFSVELIHTTHSIPDTFNLAITTPAGLVYHASDFKFDWTPVGQRLTEVGKIASFGNRGVSLLLSDCLRSENKGYTLSEMAIEAVLEQEMRDVTGKILITTMSSNVSRWQQAVNAARRLGRRVVLTGRSIEKIVKIARQLGYLKIPNEMVVKLNRARFFPPAELCYLVAGSQGQSSSALARIAHGEFREVVIKPGDRVILSSDYIPGNEAAIYKMIDDLSWRGAEVSYADIHDNLHVSGHAAQAELALMLNLVRPKTVVPIGGSSRQMKQYESLAKKMGERVLLPEPGQALLINRDKVSLGEVIPVRSLLVDSRAREF
ncbi:MAG: ribonuclease J [Candidatus Shapirobacteria bacterium]